MLGELMLEEYPFKHESYQIIGAAMAVHSELGRGFLESVYQQALALELTMRKIPFREQEKINIQYKGITLDKTFAADFFCFDKIIVEIKAVETLSPAHEAQLINYLRASDVNLGLLINFGEDSLRFRRFVN